MLIPVRKTCISIALPFLATLLLGSGCKKAESAAADPKASFVAFKDRLTPLLSAALTHGIPVNATDRSLAYKFVLDGKQSYDVTKTESVVSPFTGVIRLGFAKASWSDGNEISDGYKALVLQFALQDGKWVSQKVCFDEERELDPDNVGFDQDKGLTGWKPGGLKDVTDENFDQPLVQEVQKDVSLSQ